jgi:RNA polymerase sigma factor (sigma-70 family)
MAQTIYVEITIISRKDGTEKLERFPMDKGLYKAYLTLSEEERKKYFDKEYRSFKREQKIQRKKVSLESLLDSGEELGRSLIDDSLNPEEASLKLEQNEFLQEAVLRLKPRQRYVIIEIFKHDRTQRDVAEELGMTDQAMSMYLAYVLAKLRDDLEGKI